MQPGRTRTTNVSRLDAFGALSRNSRAMRLVVAYAAFALCEFGLWIAMLVFAYDEGGATTAGLVAVAQLVPAAAVALLVAPVAERSSPVAVLLGGYVVVALGSAVTAVLLFADAPALLVYAGAVVTSAAMAATRPAQSAVLPAVASHAEELTAGNVAIGWVENLGVLLSGVAVGVVLTWGTVGHAYAAAGLLMVAAVVVVLPLRTVALARRPRVGEPAAALPDAEPAASEPAASELAQLWRDPPARLLVGLLALEYFVVGALDLLFVVMAIEVLEAGQAWAGYLNTAYGAGAVLLGTLGVLLVGRRLGPVIVTTAFTLGLALAATTVVGLTAVVLLLAVVGGARGLFNIAVRVLLQRAVPPHRLVRLFGLSEGLNMLFLGAGSLLVPILVSLGGPSLAVVGTAALLPAVVLARLGLLRRIDQHARLPVVEISLLQQIRVFRTLPSDTLTGLAAALEEVDLEPGAVLVREGDEGDYYYAIAQGSVEIRQRGAVISTLGHADGLGELALLRATTRTATAVATTRVKAFRLDRDSFLTAVLGHAPTLGAAHAIVREHTTRDASRRDGAPPPP